MNEPASTVNITFQSPTRTSRPSAPSFHHRNLEGVPESTARQMSRDFTTYQHEPSRISEKKLYKYQSADNSGALDDECLVALDFGEIVTLEVTSSSNVAVHGRP
ncbi:hypothetical protein [Salinibacter altiplanensis]|uniref:hypothetical protein n=1 Tax=Salinibacter altiplanensis TaxID=1803181 RepID=UPI000C9EE021|nr:hypothetical protein [Salinibacter altiplanensis]